MHLTIATICRNEADRFLPKALECWTAISDQIVAVDNDSEDDTAFILADAGAKVHQFTTPMDGNEYKAREFLWNKALEAVPNGGWLLHLDADHVVANDPRMHLIGNRAVFPVYDMWTPTAYRSDAWWRVRPWWQAVRITDDVKANEWLWPERGWHSGHVPMNAAHIFGGAAEIPPEYGILHYGYATDELRLSHAAAYEARAHVLRDKELFHARTILDERPRLEPLPFEPRWPLLG